MQQRHRPSVKVTDIPSQLIDVRDAWLTCTAHFRAGGGITNLLFKLDGPKEDNPVLVRIYGQDTDILIDREKDTDLFQELAT